MSMHSISFVLVAMWRERGRQRVMDEWMKSVFVFMRV